MTRTRIVVFAALLSLALTGCAAQAGDSEADAARPVTTEESQLLAIARFNNFDAGSRPFVAEVQERGVDLRLQGWVDYAAGLGFAAATGDFPAQAMVWTASDVGILPQEPDAAGDPVLPMPALDDPAMSLGALNAESSRLDALLGVISGLGADRPDNPLLLQQAGALWLRADEIDGEAVTVFATPSDDNPRTSSSPPLTADTSPLRLWVGADGTMLRADVRLGGDWITVDFPDAPGQALALPAVVTP